MATKKAINADPLQLFKSWDLDNMVFADTETTGFGRNAEMLSYAFTRIGLSGEPETIQEEKVRPSWNTEWYHAEKIHGISPTHVQDCRTLHDAMPEIRKVCEGVKVLAWNMKFDMDFFYDKLGAADDTACLMEAYKLYKGRTKWTKLADACDEMGILFSVEEAHGAVYDATKLAELAQAFHKQLMADEAEGLGFLDE